YACGSVCRRHGVAHVGAGRGTLGSRRLRERGARAVRRKRAGSTTALSNNVFRPHLGWRLPGRLLCISVGRGPRPRRLRLVQGEWWTHAGQWREVSRDDTLAWRNARRRNFVPRVPRTGAERAAVARRAGPEIRIGRDQPMSVLE